MDIVQSPSAHPLVVDVVGKLGVFLNSSFCGSRTLDFCKLSLFFRSSLLIGRVLINESR